MKRVNYIIALAACLAALLTSCIKEENYEVSTAYLDVSLNTRGAASSQSQGDGITDVMLWAFKCSVDPETGIPTVSQSDQKASAWRTITGISTYESLENIHLYLPLCNAEPQNYVLIAVLNQGSFGKIFDRKKDANGNMQYQELVLGKDTQYNQLINASFDATTWTGWNNYVYGDTNTQDKTPTHMPVSHWKVVQMKNVYKHDTNCKHETLDVFRAVAKAQLFMIKESDTFDLEVTEAKLTHMELPKEGILLSKLKADALQREYSSDTDQPAPAWFGSDPDIDDDVDVRNLMNTKGIINDGDNKVTVTSVKDASATSQQYQFVGSTFMYEAPGVCAQEDDVYKTVSGNGYYLEVTYKVNGASQTRRVAIPCQVLRNHDYQIKATVKNDGGVAVKYTVADWEDVPWNLEFDAAQNSELLPFPSKNSKPAENQFAKVSYTLGSEDGAAKLFFQMEGPGGITWKPTILNASQDHYITRVYEVIPLTEDAEGNIVTYELSSEPVEGDIEADPDKFYCVKVIALDPTAHTARTEPIKLGITHAPQWNDEKSNLLVVNPKDSDGNYFWYGKDTSGNPSKKVGDELMVYIYPEK